MILEYPDRDSPQPRPQGHFSLFDIRMALRNIFSSRLKRKKTLGMRSSSDGFKISFSEVIVHFIYALRNDRKLQIGKRIKFREFLVFDISKTGFGTKGIEENVTFETIEALLIK